MKKPTFQSGGFVYKTINAILVSGATHFHIFSAGLSNSFNKSLSEFGVLPKKIIGSFSTNYLIETPLIFLFNVEDVLLPVQFGSISFYCPEVSIILCVNGPKLLGLHFCQFQFAGDIGNVQGLNFFFAGRIVAVWSGLRQHGACRGQQKKEANKNMFHINQFTGYRLRSFKKFSSVLSSNKYSSGSGSSA